LELQILRIRVNNLRKVAFTRSKKGKKKKKVIIVITFCSNAEGSLSEICNH